MKNILSYSVVLVLVILCLQGTVTAQDKSQSAKGKPPTGETKEEVPLEKLLPQSFEVQALTGKNKDKTVSLNELLPSVDFSEPTILMFVAETDEKKTDDDNVVALAKILDYTVEKKSTEQATRGAVIFLGGSYLAAKKELAEAKLTIPVANFSGERKNDRAEINDVYQISEKDPVTVVMWTKSEIKKENITGWKSEDLKKVNDKGAAMVVKFIQLLEE